MRVAAEGTRKVIRDHSTIGIVVTTDGSVTELAREDYAPAEGAVLSQSCAISASRFSSCSTRQTLRENVRNRWLPT